MILRDVKPYALSITLQQKTAHPKPGVRKDQSVVNKFFLSKQKQKCSKKEWDLHARINKNDTNFFLI